MLSPTPSSSTFTSWDPAPTQDPRTPAATGKQNKPGTGTALQVKETSTLKQVTVKQRGMSPKQMNRDSTHENCQPDASGALQYRNAVFFKELPWQHGTAM